MIGKAKKLHEPWNSNIFLLIERYIDRPSAALEEKIRDVSQDIYKVALNKAIEKAKIEKIEKYITKKLEAKQKVDASELAKIEVFPADIGADQYQEFILEEIKALAEEAYFFSGRMIKNPQKPTHYDPIFIYKVSEEQAKLVAKLKDSFLDDLREAARFGDRSETRCPDGIIFAFGTHIFRDKNESKFSYCSEEETKLYDNYAQLFLKTAQLAEDKPKAGSTLLATCQEIKESVEAFSAGNNSMMQHAVEVLNHAKEKPEIKAHRGVKQIIHNFLILLIGIIPGLIYLGMTADKRGSFFYRPNTDTENKIEEMVEKVTSKVSK